MKQLTEIKTNNLSSYLTFQVNIPFTMLIDSYLDLFLKLELNPEIGFTSEALDKFDISDFKKIAEKFHNNESRITFHAPFIDLSPGSPDLEILKVTRYRFEQILRLIPIFKPITIVCHAGYEDKRYSFLTRYHKGDIWKETSIKTWSWLGERILNEGSRLMLENVYEYYSADLLIILENLKKQKIGCCLDIGHLSAFSKEPLNLWIKNLDQYIGQLHLHDNKGENDDHLPLGNGNIDLDVVYKYLKKRKSNMPVLTLEPHHEDDLIPNIEYIKNNWKFD